MKAQSLTLPVLSAVLFLSMGCAHEHPKAQARVGTTQTTSFTQPVTHTTTATTTLPPKRSGTLVVSGEIASKCDIDFSSLAHAPKFAFDDSTLQPDDKSVLEQVATCVTKGPLKGHELKLVGRADPRGEEEYNFLLGEHRASAVGGYLKELGVDPQQIVETSRGKLDAAGFDEEGWQLDRRVDIELE